MGFRRHLGAGEIVSQVYHMIRDNQGHFRQAKRRNVVFMGMGEPLHNLDNVMAAFDLLTHRHGLVLSERDVAVSTSGLVPKIEALARRERRPQLMVSIAATSDEERSATMPVNRAYGLEELLRCLERYPLRKRERIMLSYVLIAGVNDSPRQAGQLAAMAERFPSLVNLIPLNEHEHAPGLREPAEAALQRFYQTLLDLGAFATIRRSRGRDVAAACGQLVHRKERPAEAPAG
jgi:23S rRNA (adenine2503-C2)-methyltransferase